MPGFVARLGDGWRRATRHPALALVPMVLALTDVGKIRAILAFDGGHVGFKFGVPLSVVTVWQFVSVPKTGVTVDPGVPLEALPLAVVTVPALLVVQAALAAGYFGSIAEVLSDSSYDFAANVGAHFRPFLVLTAVPVLALLPFAAGVVGLGALGGLRSLGLALLLVAVPAYVLLAYLFYATPYLVVLREVGAVEAARASYGFAVEGGPYLAYAVGFSLFVLAVSPVVTAVVVNVPVVGLPAGIVGGGLLGLAANVTTMRFVADVDPASPSVGTWEDGDDGDSRGGVGSASDAESDDGDSRGDDGSASDAESDDGSENEDGGGETGVRD